MVRIRVGELVQAIAYSPIEGVLAIGTRSGALSLIDAATAEIRFSIAAHPERVLADLKLPDATGESIPHVPASAIRGVSSVAFDREGRRVVTGGFGYARVWDLSTRRPVGQAGLLASVADRVIARTPLAVGYAVVDGQTRIVAADTNRLWILDQSTATILRTGETFQRGGYLIASDSAIPVEIAAGKLIVGFSDATAKLRTLDGSESDIDLRHGTGDASDIAVAPTGRRAVISGDDGLALVALNHDGLISTASPPTGRGGGEVMPINGGRTVVLNSATTGRAHWFELTDEGYKERPWAGIDPWGIYWNRNSNTLLVAVTRTEGAALIDSETGQLKLWVHDFDAANGGFGFTFPEHGVFVLVASDGTIDIRSIADGSLRQRFTELRSAPKPPGGFRGMSADIDPEYRYLTGGLLGAPFLRWDLRTGKAEPFATSLELFYTPSRTQLATVQPDGLVVMRDTKTFQPTGRTFLTQRSTNSDQIVAFSPDERHMLTVSEGRAQLWDFVSGERIGDPFPAADAYTSNVSVDFRWLLTGIDDRIVRWDLGVDRWAEIACRAAGRNLTQAEWNQFGPHNTVYSKTCDQYPSLNKRG